jgi:hypothetical protein
VAKVTRNPTANLESSRSVSVDSMAVESLPGTGENESIDSMMVDYPSLPSRPPSRSFDQTRGPNKESRAHRAPYEQTSTIAIKIVQDLSLVINCLDPDTAKDDCMSLSDTVALLKRAVLDIVKLLNVSTHSGSIQQVQMNAEHALGSSLSRQE